MLGCAVSPDGTRIVSASYDNTLRIWDADTGTCQRVLQGHTNPVSGCAVSPDGTRIVSASSDNTLRIWDADTGTCQLVLQGHTHSVLGCAVSPDGTRIVSASYDNTLRIWDADTGEQVGFRVHLLPDGEYVSLTSESDRVLHASKEAWRWLGWLAPGPDGKITRYPAEIFGELPA